MLQFDIGVCVSLSLEMKNPLPLKNDRYWIDKNREGPVSIHTKKIERDYSCSNVLSAQISFLVSSSVKRKSSECSFPDGWGERNGFCQVSRRGHARHCSFSLSIPFTRGALTLSSKRVFSLLALLRRKGPEKVSVRMSGLLRRISFPC